MTRPYFAMCLTLLAVSTGATMALAGSKDTPIKAAATQAKSACDSDIQKFCSDVAPGEGRLASCLNDNESKVSDGCIKAQSKLSATISEQMDKANVAFRKECGKDIDKFCSEVPTGRGRILDCLADKQDSLSKSCKSFQSKVAKKLNQALG